MGRENHNRKDRFLREKTREREKTTWRRGDELIFKRRITVVSLQMIRSLIVPPPSLAEKEYLYKLRDDVQVADISGGCNRMIIVVVTVRFCIYPYLSNIGV